MIKSPIYSDINKFGLCFAGLILLLSSGPGFSQALIWQEDFVNGLNSVNGTWVVSGPDSDWAYSLVGTDGEWSTGTPDFASNTAANGFMLFDADAINWVVSPNYVPRVGMLTSPAIDLSGEASVVLQYQSMFRYCCAEGNVFTVSVSGNGGSSWTAYDARNGLGINVQSQNPFTHLLDISAVAAQQSDVRIRFTFGDGSITHYFWVIDDVELFGQTVDCDGANAVLAGESISAGQTVTCNVDNVLVQNLALDGTLIINKTGDMKLQTPINVFDGGILKVNEVVP